MSTILELTAQIVSAHASQNKLTTEELTAEISKVHKMMQDMSEAPAESGKEKHPDIEPHKSIQPNQIVCLICGKGGMKTLTRHIRRSHNMTPAEYRRQFGFASTQPLTAKKFSAKRHELAKSRNLADNLAKARAKRAANLKGQTLPPPGKAVAEKNTKQGNAAAAKAVKPVKTAKSAKPVKSAKPAKSAR